MAEITLRTITRRVVQAYARHVLEHAYTDAYPAVQDRVLFLDD